MTLFVRTRSPGRVAVEFPYGIEPIAQRHPPPLLLCCKRHRKTLLLNPKKPIAASPLSGCLKKCGRGNKIHSAKGYLILPHEQTLITSTLEHPVEERHSSGVVQQVEQQPPGEKSRRRRLPRKDGAHTFEGMCGGEGPSHRTQCSGKRTHRVEDAGPRKKEHSEAQ